MCLLGMILVSMALFPALCEELFFRGFSIRALCGRGFRRCRHDPAYRGSVRRLSRRGHQRPFVERLLPSSFLGLVLGWVVGERVACFPAVVLHAFTMACCC